jgi:hypothetical protein
LQIFYQLTEHYYLSFPGGINKQAKQNKIKHTHTLDDITNADKKNN